MQEILSKRIRIPYNYLKLGRTLLNQILPIFVSMDNSWEINKAIVLSALIQKVFLFLMKKLLKFYFFLLRIFI